MTKALYALEEAVQDCRYGKPERTFAIRFALAYLYSLRPGDRVPFVAMWRALHGWNDLHRWREADQALTVLYQRLGRRRDEDLRDAFWHIAQERADRRRKG